LRQRKITATKIIPFLKTKKTIISISKNRNDGLLTPIHTFTQSESRKCLTTLPT
jgi:hypothetical protein